MSDWQPIETAPKDGTWVMLTGGGLGHALDNYLASPPCVVALFDEGSALWWACAYEDTYGHYDNPTHWMPLPEPPGEENE